MTANPAASGCGLGLEIAGQDVLFRNPLPAHRAGGANWEPQGLLRDRAAESGAYTYTATHGSVRRDGTVVVVAARYPAREEEILRFNPQTGGLPANQTVLFRPANAGRTWSEPEVVPYDGPGVADAPSAVIELADGDLRCVWWSTQPCVTHARHARLRVKPA